MINLTNVVILPQEADDGYNSLTDNEVLDGDEGIYIYLCL